MKRSLLILVFCFASSVQGMELLAELRMQKRFGVGFSAAGPLSMLGIEADVNLSPTLSLSAGFGTGIDYSTMMIKARYFLLGEWVSPYLGIGISRWWTEGTTAEKVSPSVLMNRFLGPDYDLTQGFNLFVLSPSVGVQFMHPMGMAFFAEIQYLFKLFDFANGTYAGMGVHWYF